MSDARMRGLFDRIDVGEVWGVGRSIGDKLRTLGIQTVRYLKEASPRDMRARFGVVLERTCHELHRLSCLDLEEVAPARKEIVSSKSSGSMVRTVDELAEAVTAYVTRASEKLRSKGSVCGAVNVFVQTNRFRTDDLQYSNGLTMPIIVPTDDSRVLAGAALHGLVHIYREGFRYKKAGVM